jgi:hypothetical protein
LATRSITQKLPGDIPAQTSIRRFQKIFNQKHKSEDSRRFFTRNIDQKIPKYFSPET